MLRLAAKRGIWRSWRSVDAGEPCTTERGRASQVSHESFQRLHASRCRGARRAARVADGSQAGPSPHNWRLSLAPCRSYPCRCPPRLSRRAQWLWPYRPLRPARAARAPGATGLRDRRAERPGRPGQRRVPDPLRLHPWPLSRRSEGRRRLPAHQRRLREGAAQPDSGGHRLAGAAGRPGAGVLRPVHQPRPGRAFPPRRAPRVLFSQPMASEADIDATIVYGVNQQDLSGRETLVSNASCTTNCGCRCSSC